MGFFLGAYRHSAQGTDGADALDAHVSDAPPALRLPERRTNQIRA